jgi:hypothetical protein
MVLPPLKKVLMAMPISANKLTYLAKNYALKSTLPKAIF